MLLLTLWLCLVKTFVKLSLKYSKIYVKSVRKEADLKNKLLKYPCLINAGPK